MTRARRRSPTPTANPTTPGGNVSFSTTSAGGFPDGNVCSLKASPEAPTVPYCAVRFIPPNSELPSITATYTGDTTHAASAGQTQFLGAPSEEETDCLGGCNNLELKEDPNLEPDQTNLQLTAGCGGASAPSATKARAAGVTFCELTVKELMESLEKQGVTSVTPETLKQAEELIKAQAAKWKVIQDTQTKIFEEQQSITQNKAGTQAKDFQQFQRYLQGSTSTGDANTLAANDSALSGEFPAQPAGAAARASAAAVSLGPESSLVLASIYAEHPTSADVAAFGQAIVLATSPTSPPPARCPA